MAAPGSGCSECSRKLIDSGIRDAELLQPRMDVQDIVGALAAIAFGDAKDPASRVSRLARDGRAFRALEAVNAGPAITYLARVRPEAET